MKLLRLFALVVMTTFAGCVVQPKVWDGQVGDVDTINGPAILTGEKINTLALSTARFEALSADETKYEWVGTAWAIYQGEEHSYWMTCRHVAENAPISRIRYRDYLGLLHTAPAYSAVWSATDDIAIFLSSARPGATLSLISEEYEDHLLNYYLTKEDRDKPDIIFIADGHIGWTFPAMVTVGYFKGFDALGNVRSTVGGWYGVSGSALVDLRTMGVVGIRHKFGSIAGQTDDVVAVPSSVVRSFVGDFVFE